MRRALLALAALAVLAMSAASCLSPTLPLPPPDHPDAVSVDKTGLWQITGQCDAGALVSVFDMTTGRGVQVEDRALTGSYHVALAGQACDVVRVEQQSVDGDVSAPTEFLLQAWSQGEPVDPNSCP